MSPPPFIAIKLKRGWTLEADSAALLSPPRRVVPELPSGARLQPALEVPPPSQPTAAERELARYLHVVLPDGVDPEAVLETVLGWRFVESAEVVDE